MVKEIERQKSGNGLWKLGIIISSLPSLIFRFGRVFFNFKLEAKKSGKIFKNELISRGLDSTAVKNLTNIYLESSSLTQYVKFLK